MAEYFLGIDFGGTNTKIGCYDGDLRLIGKMSVPTHTDITPDMLVDLLSEAALQLFEQHDLSMDELRGIGIGSPGPVDLTNGVVLAAPNLPLFRNTPLRRLVSDKFDKPTIFENDANAACWGEHVLGAGKGVADLVLMTLGTGIGGGIVTAGKLVHGANDGAGELGHVIIYPNGRKCACGQLGCVEAYASANSTAKRAAEMLEAGQASSLQAVLKGKGKITSKDVYEHAAAGDALARQITEGTAEALALACRQLQSTVGPSLFVLAGGMIAAGAVLLEQIREAYAKLAAPGQTLSIRFATLGEDAGIIGNAALAIKGHREGTLFYQETDGNTPNDETNPEREHFEFVRLVGTERRVGSELASVSRHWQGERECFMMISPHDDDVVLGAGLLIQLAKRENVPVHILVVTDGSMGYCSPEEKERIVEIRRKETFECYQSLGVRKENIVWLGFPDCQLNYYRGRRQVVDERMAMKGYVGLQNTFTHYLRKIRPTQCFLPTSADLHPDHQIVFEEFLISMFHAGGNIWPELGKPLAKIPYVHELAVYCDFSLPPTLRMITPQSYMENKLKALAAFKSQKQISSLIENVRACGPQEYLRAIEFKLYHPASYFDLFEHRKYITIMR